MSHPNAWNDTQVLYIWYPCTCSWIRTSKTTGHRILKYCSYEATIVTSHESTRDYSSIMITCKYPMYHNWLPERNSEEGLMVRYLYQVHARPTTTVKHVGILVPVWNPTPNCQQSKYVPEGLSTKLQILTDTKYCMYGYSCTKWMYLPVSVDRS